ncbi:hypothetical protein F5Y19DRAFT_483066 [Xylariaceae sp. FL1651]|nr:hypothetical protein F5Y19DRAFT_483066 [Xylariaceae sp. FL1651]
MIPPISQAISALKQALPQALFVAPDATEEYDKLNGSYLSGFESDLMSACIFLPKPKEKVASFVRIMGSFADDAQFATRAAGQQPLPGCADVQNGITVDLRGLKGIEAQNRQINVAAGGIRGSIYKYLEPLGLGVTGGKSTSCGTGGLATQSGLSFFASREGLICDNAVNFEVGLAPSEIANANAQKHSDL